MKILSNFESPTLSSGTYRGDSREEINPNTQSFNHSLLTFINPSSKTGTPKEEAPKPSRPRGFAIEDSKPAPKVAAQVVPQSLILPAVQVELPVQKPPMQQVVLVASPDSSVTAGAQPTVSGNDALPGLPIFSGADSRVPNSASQEFAIPSQPAPMITSPDALQSSITNQSTVSKLPCNSAQSTKFDTLANGIVDVLAEANMHSSLSDAASSNALNEGPSANQNGGARSSAESQIVLPKAFQDTFMGVVRNAYSNAGPAASQNAVANLANADLYSAAAQTKQNQPSSTGNSTAQTSLGTQTSMDSSAVVTAPSSKQSESPNLGSKANDSEKTDLDALTPGIKNTATGEGLDTYPAPVLNAPIAPADRNVTSKTRPVLADQVIQPWLSPEKSVSRADNLVSVAAANLLVATPQLAKVALSVGLAGVSNLIPASLKSVANGKDTSKGAASDTDMKQQPLPVSAKPDFLSGLLETTHTSDLSRGDASAQGQSAASNQTSTIDHAVVAVTHSQATILAAPVLNASTLAASPDQKSMTAGNPVYASVAAPQSAPIINTAKLIQSIGRSEMRVGMRSNEFGNISISTSTNRGLISAQISLDHSELARTLAAHLPEMQAKLGGNEAVDVRIDTRGIGAGQGDGTTGSLFNGSSNPSQDGKQQPGSTGSHSFGSGFIARQASPVAATTTMSDGRLNARLDVRF